MYLNWRHLILYHNKQVLCNLLLGLSSRKSILHLYVQLEAPPIQDKAILIPASHSAPMATAFSREFASGPPWALLLLTVGAILCALARAHLPCPKAPNPLLSSLENANSEMRYFASSCLLNTKMQKVQDH